MIVVFGGEAGPQFQRFPSFCSLYFGDCVTRMVFNVKMAIILFANMPGAMVLGGQSSGQCCYSIAGFIDNAFMIIFDYTSTKDNDYLGSFQQSSLMTYLIFVIFFTRAKFLENKIYTEKRRKLRQNTQ